MCLVGKHPAPTGCELGGERTGRPLVSHTANMDDTNVFDSVSKSVDFLLKDSSGKYLYSRQFL